MSLRHGIICIEKVATRAAGALKEPGREYKPSRRATGVAAKREALSIKTALLSAFFIAENRQKANGETEYGSCRNIAEAG